MFEILTRYKRIVFHFIIWTALFFIIYLQFYIIGGENLPFRIFNRFWVTLLGFYINFFFLVPKLLFKRKAILYIISILTIIIISISLFKPIFLVNDFNAISFENYKPVIPEEIEQVFIEGIIIEELIEDDLSDSFIILKGIEYARPILFNILFLIFGTSMRMYDDWSKNEKNRKEIETQKVTAELQSLKNQLNPHFLFNSLNNIYSLTKKKSNDAPEAIITLSELMRYMLYQTNDNLVLLQNELNYIQNYVKLQRLRIANNENVMLNIRGIISNQKIEPLLFISFIENAFKYGTDFRGKIEVKIGFYIKEDELQFTCTNLIGNRKKNEVYGGIGIDNTKERLRLLYPKKHKLVVEEEDNRFIVDLTIKLTK